MKFSQQVVQWQLVHGRKDLPWQGSEDKPVSPYHVWLSEIMLQQTQVIKVIEYFNRFILAMPTLDALAAADEQQVMALWSGLGYYNRARNLHKTAQICQQNYQSQLPCDLQQLIDLPGIGRSTAAAIMSLAYHQAEPIMEGNVKRVFARHFLVAGEPNKSSTLKELWQLADANREHDNPAAYAQGLMDLGAKICTKHQPQCESCPIMTSCLAKAQNLIALYPEKKQKVKQVEVQMHAVLYVKDKRFGLTHRNSPGIWHKLWFLPVFDSANELKVQHPQTRRQFSLTHKLTHRILHIHVYTHVHTENDPIEHADLSMVCRSELSERPHPKALIHLLNQYENH
ncbi:MAG: A/G-specific adenine glycosylase [Marinicella sp.]